MSVRSCLSLAMEFLYVEPSQLLVSAAIISNDNKNRMEAGIY